MAGAHDTAICDGRDAAREQVRALADSKAAVTQDYDEHLKRRAVDAVLIGSPDQ